MGLAADDVDAVEEAPTADAVDACIVLASAEGPSEEVNKKLAAYVGKRADKMVGFAAVEPDKDRAILKDPKSIEEKLGLKGVVLHCSARGLHPTHTDAMRFYDSAQELGLPVFFHNAGDALGAEAILEYAQPYMLDEIAREFTELKIIIGSMGVPFVQQTLCVVARHENVYADLTILCLASTCSWPTRICRQSPEAALEMSSNATHSEFSESAITASSRRSGKPRR
jgi:predicted TIM-barrel fold metal-dependent hydrolase